MRPGSALHHPHREHDDLAAHVAFGTPMKPELDFSSGFYGLAPDNVKVKKTVRLRPLPLELGASLVYNIESRGIKWKLNCKETLLGGKVTADIPNRALEYRKRFSLPLVRLNCLVLGLRAALCPETHQLKTSCRVGFELRQGTAEITKVNTVRVKPQVFFKNIGLEAVTDISFQVPKHLFFELPSDLGRGFPGFSSLGRTPRPSLPMPHVTMHHSGSGSMRNVGSEGALSAAGSGAGAPAEDNDAWGISMEMQEINVVIKL